MPTLPKLPKKPSARRKERQSLYQLKQWRDLSEWYRMEHPICEVCGDEVAAHVHHIDSPFAYGISEGEKMARLLDVNNLMSVCVKCHNALHSNVKH